MAIVREASNLPDGINPNPDVHIPTARESSPSLASRFVATGGIITTSAPAFEGTQTWNAGGVTFTGMKFNVTDTASAAGSLLMDLKIGGASKFSVTKAGVVTGTSLALGGATIGSNALAVTGTVSNTYFSADGTNGFIINNNAAELKITSVGGGNISLTPTNTPATLQLGRADVASPIAQTIKFQDVVAGTSNTAGVNATIQAPAGTGTGNGGSLIFQVAPAGSSGTAKNAWATALTIDSTKTVTFNGNIWLGAANPWIAAFGRGGIGFAGDGVFEIFSTGYANNVRITAGASNLATFNGGITAGSILTTTASTTARASLNIPSGVAPTTPTNGDIWSDGSDLKVRLGGVTYTLTKV